MPLQMTESEAAAFFAKIGRPLPLSSEQVSAAGFAAVQRAFKVHEVGVKAVRAALRQSGR